MPTKRWLTAVVCSGKTLVVAGGKGGGDKRLSTAEVMDTETLQWSSGDTTGGGGGGGGRTPPPNRPAGAMLFSRNLHGTASKPYVDQEMDIRTFYVTQDREKPTDSA